MMYEEDMGSIVGSTGTQAVAPVTVKGIPPERLRLGALHALTDKLTRSFTFKGANQQHLVKVKQDDDVYALCELISIVDDKADGNPRTVWSLKEFSINDKPVRIAPGLQPRAKPGTEVPPGERMKFNVSFNMNQGLMSEINANLAGENPSGERVYRLLNLYLNREIRPA